MNNKFSDIDKVIITAWLFFGAGVGAFVAPLFRASLMLAGGIGLFAGATVAYVLFFEPWRRRYGLLFPYPTEEDDLAEDEDDETESDISEFIIKDSFEAEGVISEDDVVFNNSEVDETDASEFEDNSEVVAENEAKENDTDASELEEDIEFPDDESDEELEIDDIESEEYEDEDLSDGEDSELDESEEDKSLEEDDESEEQDSLAAFHGSRNQIHSSYNEDEEPQGFKAWITPVRLPITLAIAWFFISGYISSNHSEIIKTVSSYFPAWFFTILPILFLIGLSGLIGVLFRERDDSLEISSEENAAYLINLLKIFTGWGIGIYAILVNI
ncbi:MAG: hypothetical protein JNM55_04355 [Anaerolineales bacterium]|nr:hypothetical protein [Anaerolineales bacterium]